MMRGGQTLFFQGVGVFESASLNFGDGITLPGYGITVGLNISGDPSYAYLMQHEFGHILQANDIGEANWYKYVGPASLASAAMDGVRGWNHNTFWTETWANYLSSNYFGQSWITTSLNPVQNIPWLWHEYLKF